MHISQELAQQGLLRFGRYAFPPNRLGYCGPDDHRGLFQHVVAQKADGGLLELAKNFEGAYPYLRFIAESNGIKDPFDERVVEAYWVGNALLDAILPEQFARFVDDTFKVMLGSERLAQLKAKLHKGGRPHHNFHVFNIFLLTQKAKAGSSPASSRALAAMDGCRISWGQVVGVVGSELIVNSPRVKVADNRLVLGAPEPIQVQWKWEQNGWLQSIAPGSIVSLHWDWVCEVLDPKRLERLKAFTSRFLALANDMI
ncbi:conserved protein of unknown function [Candidatus Hydrogenisulfobacillus filiaventi]|uniref:Uncharacterized protein n=1 Tax=Candidatus Hydrogenisulfobacillus filiaventi TaxID=2707344 RepID=A0A6F8ZG57_9FIRM|nr:conserved protein of unknown function [Candidatus Hydrogenisulfobacillus filiaventi]